MAKQLATFRFKNKKKFDLAIDDFIENVIPADQLKLQKKIAIDLLTRIIDKTPVGNPSFWKESSLPAPPGYVGGRARANWQISTFAPGNSDLDAIDPVGGATVGLGVGKLVSAKAGGTIWIFNNVRYIKRLEMGHSHRQAPLGMVAVSLAEIEAGLR
jgi:hypothetical protein